MANIKFGSPTTYDTTPTASATLVSGGTDASQLLDLRADTYEQGGSASTTALTFTFNSLVGTPSVDYVAVVDIIGLADGDDVDITVTGTGGWNNSGEQVIPTWQGTGEHTQDFNGRAYTGRPPKLNMFTTGTATSVTQITVGLDPVASKAPGAHQVMFGTSYSPTWDFDLGSSLQVVDTSKIQFSEGGYGFITKGHRRRVFNFSLSWLSSSEIDEFVAHMEYMHARPMFVMPYSDDPNGKESLLWAFMGVLNGWSMVRQYRGWRYAPLQIVEI